MNQQTQALIHARTFLRALAAQSNTRGRWQSEDPAAAECLRIVEDALVEMCPDGLPIAGGDDLRGRWQTQKVPSGLLALPCREFVPDTSGTPSTLRCAVCGHFQHQHTLPMLTL